MSRFFNSKRGITMSLAAKDLKALHNLGIEVSKTHDGNRVVMNTKGVGHLLNHMAPASRKGKVLDLSMLKSLAAQGGVTGGYRDLRAILQNLPTHDSPDFCQRVTVYLNKTPVSTLHDFPPNYGNGGEIHVGQGTGLGGSGVFNLCRSMALTIQFTAKEAETLKHGGYVEVSVDEMGRGSDSDMRP